MGLVCENCYAKTGLNTENFIMIRNGAKIIDSITLMEIFGRCHQKAKADCFVNQNMERSMHLTARLMAVSTELLELKREITPAQGFLIREAYHNLLK